MQQGDGERGEGLHARGILGPFMRVRVTCPALLLTHFPAARRAADNRPSATSQPNYAGAQQAMGMLPAFQAMAGVAGQAAVPGSAAALTASAMQNLQR